MGYILQNARKGLGISPVILVMTWKLIFKTRFSENKKKINIDPQSLINLNLGQQIQSANISHSLLKMEVFQLLRNRGAFCHFLTGQV